MLKKLASTLALTTLLFSATSQALPIVQADAFSAGDNKAALETNTGLIWMDFGVNNQQSYAEVVSLLSTDYTGWRLPTADEVRHLMSALFGDLPEWYAEYPGFNALFATSGQYQEYFSSIYDVFGQSPDSTTTITDEFGNTIESWTSRSAFAVFMKEPGVSGFISIDNPYDATRSNSALYVEMYGTDISDWYGTMLVKGTNTAVPEPTSLMLLMLGILGLAARGVSLRR